MGGRRPLCPGARWSGLECARPLGAYGCPCSLDSQGLPASACGFTKVGELICLLVCGTSAGMRLSLGWIKAWLSLSRSGVGSGSGGTAEKERSY